MGEQQPAAMVRVELVGGLRDGNVEVWPAASCTERVHCNELHLVDVRVRDRRYKDGWRPEKRLLCVWGDLVREDAEDGYRYVWHPEEDTA